MTDPAPTYGPRGPNILLMGVSGAGKTYSLSTLKEAGYKLACIFTEPGADESLLDGLNDKGLSLEDVHWHYCPPASSDWTALKGRSQLVGLQTFESISKLKNVDKSKYLQLGNVIDVLANFTCQRTGKVIGPVDQLGPDWALALDSLTGINKMCMDLVRGGRPTMSPGEWGLAQDQEEMVLDTITSNTKCLFVCTSHIEREQDEVAGGMIITIASIGKKLGPRLPRFFGEGILAYYEPAVGFRWSTSKTNFDLKNRLLPKADNLEPSFVQIRDLWLKRYGLTKEQWHGQGPQQERQSVQSTFSGGGGNASGTVVEVAGAGVGTPA